MATNATAATTAATLVTLPVDLEHLMSNFNQFFLIINGIFVLLMQPGFALLECGSVRSKNATNILVKNMLDAFFAGVAFWLVGYALAYGEGNFFLGTRYFACVGLDETKYAHWFFQYVFAATASTIVSGSLAERCDTTAYFTYSTIITGFLYPVIVHWSWTTEGWLKIGDGNNGYHDFAGSGVVHLTGGTCALIGAIFLGPRQGRFENGEVKEIRGHSVPLAVTGGMILMIGFLAFNGGSQLEITNPGDGTIVARAVCNTTISGCFGGLTALLLVRLGVLGPPRVLSVIHAMNGALVGMVSICAGVDKMHMWGAALTGIGAGGVYLMFHVLILKWRIDDPLDAIAVHMGGGLWGLMAAPLFRTENGVLLSGNSRAGLGILWNIAGACAIFTWSAVLSCVMFGSLKLLGLLRVDRNIEMKGLDLEKHNEPAYPAESWFEEQYQTLRKNFDRRTSVTPFDISLPPQMRAAKMSLDNIYAEHIIGTVNNTGNVNKGFVNDNNSQPSPVSDDTTKL